MTWTCANSITHVGRIPVSRRGHTLKTQLVAWLGLRSVEFINGGAQLIALLVGCVLFYQSSVYTSIKRALDRVVSLRRYVYFSVGPNQYGFGVGTHPQAPDAPRFAYLIAAIIVVLLVLVSGHSPGYWLAYPLGQFADAVSVWQTTTLSWSALLVPIKSLLLLCWGVLSFLLIWAGALAITTKALLLLLSGIHRGLSPRRFNLFLFLVFLLSGLVIIAAGTDLLITDGSPSVR